MFFLIAYFAVMTSLLRCAITDSELCDTILPGDKCPKTGMPDCANVTAISQLKPAAPCPDATVRSYKALTSRTATHGPGSTHGFLLSFLVKDTRRKI